MLGADLSHSGQVRRLRTERDLRAEQARLAKRAGELLLAAQAEIAVAELDAAIESLALQGLRGTKPGWPTRLLHLVCGAPA